MKIKTTNVSLLKITTVLVLTFGVALFYQACNTSGDESLKSVEERLAQLSQEERGLVNQARQVMGVIPEKIESESNPLNETKVKLGQMLYYDTRLSRSNTISCNSCHNMATYGVDNNETSMGHGWQLGPRNAPTVLNAAGQIAQFWDGRSPDVEHQATGPVGNPIEMGGKIPEKDTGHLIAVERIASIDEYQRLFKKAFKEAENEVNLKNIGRAIGAFERTLMTKASIDKFLEGNADALSSKQKKGLKTFIETGCTTCHSGTYIGGNMYQKFGLVNGPYWDFTESRVKDTGRYEVTGNEVDK